MRRISHSFSGKVRIETKRQTLISSKIYGRNYVIEIGLKIRQSIRHESGGGDGEHNQELVLHMQMTKCKVVKKLPKVIKKETLKLAI